MIQVPGVVTNTLIIFLLFNNRATATTSPKHYKYKRTSTFAYYHCINTKITINTNTNTNRYHDYSLLVATPITTFRQRTSICLTSRLTTTTTTTTNERRNNQHNNTKNYNKQNNQNNRTGTKQNKSVKNTYTGVQSSKNKNKISQNSICQEEKVQQHKKNQKHNIFVRRQQQEQHQKSTIQSRTRTTSSQWISRLPIPDIMTQLQYTRNGHAVIRNLLSSIPTNSTKISLVNLRDKLYQYGQSQQLLAWQQKVEVAFDDEQVQLKYLKQNNKKSISPTSDISTIDECRRILIQLGIPADNLPFLQYFNCWKHVPEVNTLCHALAEIAAVLLDVESVRLYQDSLFWKRCNNNNNSQQNQNGDGPTPWHTDAKMCPFDTSQFITFWIPLQPVPKGGSGLVFCSKSHSDFALPYWNSDHLVQQQQQNQINNKNQKSAKSQWDRLEERYMNRGYINYIDKSVKRQQSLDQQYVDYMPLHVGDVTVHAGWTLHCADPCSPYAQIDRLALAISYVNSRAPVRYDAQQSVMNVRNRLHGMKNISTTTTNNGYTAPAADREDIWSYQDWVTDVPCNTFEWDHPLVPILWPPPSKKSMTIQQRKPTSNKS